MKRAGVIGEDFHFEVRHPSRLRSWGAEIRMLLGVRMPRISGWVRFFDPHPMRMWRPRRARTIFSSAFFHFAVFFLLITIPWAALLPPSRRASLPIITADYQLVYPLPPHKVEIHSQPKSAAKGEHKAPKPAPSAGRKLASGSGVKSPQPVPKFTLVLKPPHADNHNQTIIQAGTPPNVIIHHYVPLPNVLLAGLVAKNDPRMPTSGTAPKAVVDPTAGAPAMNVPAPVIPDMALAVQVPAEKQPLLASPEVALPIPAPEQSLGSIYASRAKNNASQSARGLLVLGANPAPPSTLMSVPMGNRYGQFSVSLLGGKNGLPSGPGGPMMGGGGFAKIGAGKAAGNGSGSAAAGVSGDIGGAENGAAAMAAFGPESNGSGNEEGILPPWMAANLVYPVSKAMKIPAINLIVTAGPVGGGGLGMFGVLSCSTIYTIYLSMPGKPWVLQYCQQKAATSAAPAPDGGVVRLGSGITPPFPLSQYDFHRPPIDPYKRDRMIVLKGVITREGKVTNLRLYEGIGSIADEAAMTAFSRWKFHPAQDSKGKPVAVEMLVGIPAKRTQ